MGKARGKYYFQGTPTLQEREMMCEMAKEGSNVYQQGESHGKVYYYQGDMDAREEAFQLKLISKGYTIKKQQGKPTGCGSPGHPC